MSLTERRMTQSRLRWGFATAVTGEIVIRNWYLVAGALGGALFGCYLLLAELNHRGGAVVVILTFFATLFFAYFSYLEILGVAMGDAVIMYPVRIGLGGGSVPLFRGAVPVDDVLQVSSLRKPKGMYVAYLTGEFGEAKILFDRKGGRDRFFAILQKRRPKLRIYRWT
jgi:hypothetical protein